MLLLKLLLAMHSSFGSIADGQERSYLTIIALEKMIVWDDQAKPITLHLRLNNQGKKKLLLYSIYNKWVPVAHLEYLTETSQLGFNLAIFNIDGKYCFPRKGMDEYHIRGQSTSVKYLAEGHSDSALFALEELIGHMEQLVLEQEQKIKNSKMWIMPADSLETVLEIDLTNYSLDKGEYGLEIYYVINKKILKYTQKSDDLFMGYLKSNRIQLIVK